MSNAKNVVSLASLMMMMGALGGCAVQSEEPVPTGEGPSLHVKGSGCLDLKMGGETSCKPTWLWKQYASDDCASRGMILTAYTVSVPCDKDGDNRYIDYTCCPANAQSCTKQSDCNPFGAKCCSTDMSHSAGVCGAPGVGCTFGDFGP